MTDPEYSETQAQIVLLAQVARGLDLDGFLERIDDAHALTPVLDPTLYRLGIRQLQQVEELARAIRTVKKIADTHASPAKAGDPTA